MASGYHIGQQRYRIFALSQKVLLDSSASKHYLGCDIEDVKAGTVKDSWKETEVKQGVYVTNSGITYRS